MMRRNLLMTVGAFAVFATAAPVGAYPRPGVTYRVSVATKGGQGNGASAMDVSISQGVSMTPDGRYVAFSSLASNLVAGDRNGTSDVFVHDRATGRTEIASVDSHGRQGTTSDSLVWATLSDCSQVGSNAAVISANGRYVAFDSCFGNLVPGCDTLLAQSTKVECLDRPRVFVHDRVARTTTVVSVATNGDQANGESSLPSISADGRYVAFESYGSNLGGTCPPDLLQQPTCALLASNVRQVYVRDRQAGTTTLAAVATGGAPADGDSRGASISPDGRYVAFVSAAGNLVADDDNLCPASSPGPVLPSCPDVFLRDLRTGRTELVSVGLDGTAANDHSGYPDQQRVMISSDNRYVAFNSRATDLVPARTKGVAGPYDEYVRDRVTGRTVRVSVDSAGQNNVYTLIQAAMSPDGRYVAFVASGSSPGVAVHDLLTGSTEAYGPAAGTRMASPRIGAGGRYVAFSSDASSLVPKDTNGAWDVFVRDRGTALGVGGLAASGRLVVASLPSFARTGVVTGTGGERLSPALTAAGADLAEASVRYRPHDGDLFVRLELARMPAFATASPGLVYGVRLTAGNTDYEVRAVKGGPDALTGGGASFGLFRRGPAGWAKVATLRGGYGTTGQRVVLALPLADLGLRDGGRLSRMSAFTAVGDYLAGPVARLDEITLT